MLMMFTTTVSVSSIYSTSSVVMVPIIWLCITVVVIVISFSIIVSCMFISLLLVTLVLHITEQTVVSKLSKGYAVMHCATSQKVAGSFPDGVIRIFH